MNHGENVPVVVDFDIGCQPSPSGCREMVLQNGELAFLLFDAVSNDVDPNSGLAQLGIAIIECEEFTATKLGYPNDEGLPEHPLWDFGLSSASGVTEVKNSPWVVELESQLLTSRNRIWGRNQAVTFEPIQMRHFLIALKEATFECVASNLRVVSFADGFDEAFAFVKRRLSRHE